MTRSKPIIDYTAYLAVRTFVCIIQAMPLSTCQAWSRRLGWLFWHVLKVRRGTVEDNLKTAFPERSPREHEQIALGMWEHLLLMVCEIAHAPRKINRTNWRTHLAMPQMELMVRRLLAPRPVIIISGHLGNFEMGGYLLGLHGFPSHTIARTLDNPYLDRWINDFRGATGQFILPKHGSSQRIEELLKSGGTLVLLGDQHAGEAACWVDFFGRSASTHKAVALFTLSGNAPTATGCVYRKGAPMHFEMEVAGLVDPAAADFNLGSIPLLSTWYTRGLENLIRVAPDQYWWLHRRWREPPARQKKLRAAEPSDPAAARPAA
ncbi:lysophospholipid acyltransferase family protein [Lacipirellula sp.]|uniref:lysophospholipid acyltransferase family protein n=1 Tax=Lacipirellula sp. TaxID=2691419 RepID=UPI003D0C9126